MGDYELLAIYLRDHAAGAVGGTELAERMAKNADGPEAEALGALSDAIAEDKATLEAVLETLGIERPALKAGAAWLGEKLGRLKLNGRVFEESPLSRVLELEGLAGGITAKLSLWRALRRVAQDDARLLGFDFDLLAERAEDQREQVHRLHDRAVERAFAAA